MNKKIVAIIVAGGSSVRMGHKLPKQHHVLDNGKTVLWHSLQPFLYHPDICALQVVLNKGSKSYLLEKKLLRPVIGGISRQNSVFNGLKAVEHLKPDFVLIHDAARPFVTKELIDRVIMGLTVANAVIPVLPMTDTVVLSEKEWVSSPIDRNTVKTVQTPQGFAFDLIFDLHNRYAKDCNFTDDSSLCLRAGIRVLTVDGDVGNKKITYFNDLRSCKP